MAINTASNVGGGREVYKQLTLGVDGDLNPRDFGGWRETSPETRVAL